jgi:hypothetical protein|nr:MAG TPA: hypothetical protein [Caudoviricetes sp.]
MLFTLLSLYTQFDTEQEPNTKVTTIDKIQKSEINDNPIKQPKNNKLKSYNFDTIMQEEINKLKQKEQ